MPINFHCECGKPFWTADANAGRRMLCTRCGRELGIPGSVPPQLSLDEIVFLDSMPTPTPSRTSVKAVLSLILGLASLFFFFVTGIPAILLGSIALVNIRRSSGRLDGKWLSIIGIVLGSFGTLVSFLFLTFLIPNLAGSGQAVQRSLCMSNLKQIGLALHNYHSVWDQFPPAAITDSTGKPFLSWRVAILPFLDQQELYDKFKLDEPWDSPTNRAAASQMPSTFACPSDGESQQDRTRYQFIIGSGSLHDGKSAPTIGSVTDGTANTFLVVEARSTALWTKPDDVEIRWITDALGSEHPGGCHVLMIDGSVRFLKSNTRPDFLNASATKAGGETVIEAP